MSVGNPYYHHPQSALRQAADDVLLRLSLRSELDQLFAQGKMLGVLIVRPLPNADTCAAIHYLNNIYYLVAYSGVVNGLMDEDGYFVPPIYDLQRPDDFYLTKDAEISQLNQNIDQLVVQHKALDPKRDKVAARRIQLQINDLKNKRRALSIALQMEIFSHFDILDSSGNYRNIIHIFADARRGMPPGGAGECAAPRLLQFAYQHHWEPLELGEFWYGRSPARYHRIHGHFYPSCIEKCSPILSVQLPSRETNEGSESLIRENVTPSLVILYEDQYMLAVYKPEGLLSVPGKDLTLPNVETLLHEMYSNVKGPMLVHRLDQATSGILLAAKDQQTYTLLQRQFEEKSLQKRYLARLKHPLRSRCGIIDLPLTVNPDDRPRQVVDYQFGKHAATYYELIDHDLVALYPLTGRTHQLRVHCASPLGLDNSIAGDRLYDILDSETTNAPRLMLHAESIHLEHPVTGKPLDIVCPLSI